MNTLASGDNSESQTRSLSPPNDESKNTCVVSENILLEGNKKESVVNRNEHNLKEETLPPTNTENNLKERIKQCKNIIESLKLELSQEKARLEKEAKASQSVQENKTIPESSLVDISCSPNMQCNCLENKLMSDENVIEYEKQLQRYQNTLNMAQIEKKNAIRKHMMAKAYKLKLLEVENQCNIELLRVKQSLQCLEPLKMIASKWKSSTDEINYDFNNLELIPKNPELNALSLSDVSSSQDDLERKVKSPRSLNETISLD